MDVEEFMPSSPEVERRIADRREITQLRNELNALANDSRELTEKVSSMSGILKVFVSCLAAVITLAGWVFLDMRSYIMTIESESRSRYELVSAQLHSSNIERMRQDNAVINVLNIISLNQKRVMDQLTLPYMSPEWVKGQESE